MSSPTEPNNPTAIASKNAQKPMSDQSILWGMPLHFWDVWGVRLLIGSAIAGALTVLVTFASAYILYRVADEAQANLKRTSDAHALELRNQQGETAKANERAAQAEARAEEAKLALWKASQPRHLDTEIFLQRLKEGPPRRVQLSATPHPPHYLYLLK